MTTQPGVVYLQDNPTVIHPTIAPILQPIVKVSGFDINGLRVTYTAADDTLNIGIQQPNSQQPGQPGPVIAGDSDNNGNDGTVNPAVTAAVGNSFKDFPDFGGSESMGVFLDLKGSGYADVVAGYSLTDPRSPKQYQVAQAVVNTSLPPSTPGFGTELPGFEGNVYKVNSPAHPNFEMGISHFSQLYQAYTGKPLTSSSVISLGGFGGSQDDTGIGEAFFPEQPVNIGDATLPNPCPPASPPVFINPHENKHINTAHDTLVRVNVLGSSGFDVSKIIPSSVTLGGAHPVTSFDRFINGDEWPDATFVFRGPDINLPPGWSEATVTGKLTDGTSFSSTTAVFNKDASFYSASDVLAARQRQANRRARESGFIILPTGSPIAATSGGTLAPAATTTAAPTVSIPGLDTVSAASIKVDMSTGHKHTTPSKLDPASLSGPVIAIKRKDATTTPAAPKVSTKIQASLDKFVRNSGAVNVSTGAAVPTGGA